MSDPLRLVIFDIDGTLVDSQRAIVAAMSATFQAVGLPGPQRSEILSIVGLSLDHAIARLAPDQAAATQARLVDGYKDAYHAHRMANGAAEDSPLYPGARALIAQLAQRPDLVLGIATGKSQRGLTALLDAHDLGRLFVTRQTADFHPSKPNPSMLNTAMAEAGVGPAETVMIGDTSYDMDMARAAKVAGIGVSWGYHGVSQLHAADQIIDAFDDLPNALDNVWKVSP